MSTVAFTGMSRWIETQIKKQLMKPTKVPNKLRYFVLGHSSYSAAARIYLCFIFRQMKEKPELLFMRKYSVAQPNNFLAYRGNIS